MKKTIGLSLVVLFLALCYHVAQKIGTGSILGFQYKGQEVNVSTFLAIGASTMFGALLGVLYDHLKAKQDSKSAWWRHVGSAIASPRFGLSLIASPLVVFVVFDQLYTASADAGVALFCLQSGFFWDNTLKAASTMVEKT